MPDRPNILFITADDMNWDAVGAFGSKMPGVTPNLDRLAAEGMCFQRAHISVAICQPSRQCMMTGRYPHNSGAPGFDPIRRDVPTLQEQLMAAGYLNGILSKAEHLAPRDKFPWHFRLDKEELGAGRNPQRYYEEASAFLAMAARAGKPFFLMANSNDPHRPFYDSDDDRRWWKLELVRTMAAPSKVYTPDEVVVPGFLPDLPEVRKEVAQYYSSCRRCDDTVGAVLQALEESGQEEHTLVMFLSDNGMAFPFAKTNCYLNSTRTPWIARWPGVVRPGAVETELFINGIDFMPTILDVCGLPCPVEVDGASFLPLLRGEAMDGRDCAVTHINTIASKRSYPMRAIHQGRFGYIFSAWSDGATEFRNESQSGLTWAAMRQAAGDDPAVAARMHFYSYRAPQELYDLSADPDALHNLIDDPAYADVLRQLQGRLLEQMRRVNDPQADALAAVVAAPFTGAPG